MLSFQSPAPDVALVRLHGEVDSSTVATLRSSLRRLSEMHRLIVVQLDACTYLDSCGIGVLLETRTRTGDRVKIVLPHGHVLNRLFDILALRDVLNVAQALENVFSISDYPPHVGAIPYA